MKIRNRHLIRFTGWLGSWAVRGLIGSLRFDLYVSGAAVAPAWLPADCPQRYLYAIWHENLLLPAVKFGHPDLAVLISKHADAQILGSLITAMGMGMVLGSTNRGGIEAVRQLISGNAGRKHLAITPDGPRGPRRVVQPGVIYVASRTGMQIICVGVGYQHPWRARSWDRFAIPRPGTRARIVCSDPIIVPPGLRSEGLEKYRQIVQAEMDRLNDLAEQWAETGRHPGTGKPLPFRWRRSA
jgi:lysophospholipid acyltransferase (LPLAT)-like uncharacterized protein